MKKQGRCKNCAKLRGKIAVLMGERLEKILKIAQLKEKIRELYQVGKKDCGTGKSDVVAPMDGLKQLILDTDIKVMNRNHGTEFKHTYHDICSCGHCHRARLCAFVIRSYYKKEVEKLQSWNGSGIVKISKEDVMKLLEK